MASIIYSPKDIFEQEFKISMRGFDRAEVDEFLDNVINDYELFLAEIESLKAENERLKKELEEKTAQAPELSAEAEVEPSATPSSSFVAYGAPQPVQKPFPTVAETEAPAETPEPVEPRLSMAATNFDILKRISRLEKEVFGKQIQE